MNATTSQNFVVIDTDCELICSNVTAAEAAHIVLTDDGRDYEIRQIDGGYQLWTRQQVANVAWHGSELWSFADTPDEAEAEIFASVIGATWPRHPTAMTDADFAAMNA